MAKLGKRQKDGHSLHDHLMAAWQASGIMPDELYFEPLPLCAESVFGAWHELTTASSGGGFGPGAITHAELLAWQTINHITLSPWESSAILAMDLANRKARME